LNRRRIVAVLWAVIVAAWALPAFAAEAPAVRLAILTGEGDRTIAEPVIAQLEVALSAVKDVTLLERGD
jgi:hypothetical protein